MKPTSAKQKGSRLEREWAQLLRGFGLDKQAMRMPMSGAIRDDRFKADIHTDLPFHFELKNAETWKPLEYFRQAQSVCGSRTPAVVMSKNREEIYVLMLGTDWLKLTQHALLAGYAGKPALPKPAKGKKTNIDSEPDFAFSKKKQVRKE